MGQKHEKKRKEKKKEKETWKVGKLVRGGMKERGKKLKKKQRKK